jgi:hypothetical protein
MEHVEWPEGMSVLNRVVVDSEGEQATLSAQYLERLGVIYERYEPRLFSRMLRLIEALERKPDQTNLDV